MVNQLHVISGLPRSGSTLLSAILRQNPRFHAEITSPLLTLCATVQDKMNQNSEFISFFDDERRARILKGVVDAYYGGAGPTDVIFDTNRIWTGRLPLLKTLYPQARAICCVREIGWIIDSVEKMLRRNPLQHSRVFNFKPGASIYGRAETLMNSEKGLVGLAWSLLREAWFGEYAKSLIVIRYESLTRDPALVIGALYRELGEPLFRHDFGKIEYDSAAYDTDLGMPGLHKVLPSVTENVRTPCVPPDIFSKHATANFWNRPELNMRGVTIL